MFAEADAALRAGSTGSCVARGQRHAGAVWPGEGGWWRPARKVEGQPIDAFSAAISAVHAVGDAVAAGSVERQPVAIEGSLMV